MPGGNGVLPRSRKQGIRRPTRGRMRSAWKVYLGGSGRLSPVPNVPSPSSHCGKSSGLSSSDPEIGPGSRCFAPSVQSMSLCPSGGLSFCSLVHPAGAVPRPVRSPGAPGGCKAHMALRENHRQSEGTSLSLGYITSSWGRPGALSN